MDQLSEMLILPWEMSLGQEKKLMESSFLTVSINRPVCQTILVIC